MLGDQVVQLLKGAEREVLLVAPFMKSGALARLLAAVPEGVNCTVVSRLLPADILAGVTDLEAAEQAMLREGCRLLAHSRLHGKLYRADDRCLVGSANITAKGLGWAPSSNLEILLEVSANTSEPVAAFEAKALSSAVEFTHQMFISLRAEVERLRVSPGAAVLGSSDQIADTLLIHWLPLCRTPRQLFNIYANRETWKIIKSNMEAGLQDLQRLGLPEGLDENRFDAHVAGVLAELAIVQTVINEARAGLDSDKGKQLVEEVFSQVALLYDAGTMWEILEEWLTYFFAGQFARRSVAEELVYRPEL